MPRKVDPTKSGAPTSKADQRKLKHVLGLVALVRQQLRDYPELNRLTAGQEHSDQQIVAALFLALDDYNTTPPLLQPVTVESFPSISLLVTGTIIQLLQSLGMLQTRNQMTYSDGQGLQVSVTEKSREWMSWLQLFASSYETKKRQFKQAANVRAGLGATTGVSSEWLLVNTYFDSQGAG